MKTDGELRHLSLSDDERVANFGEYIRELADHLESGDPNEGSEMLLHSARHRSELRRAQYVPIELMVRNERLTELVIDKVIFENLLYMDLSSLFVDRAKLNDALILQMGESVRAYVHAQLSERS
jgi:hypothetical protein